MSTAEAHQVAAGHAHRAPGATTPPDAEVLDDYMRRTANGDQVAFQALFDLLYSHVRDSAACLFGPGDDADTVTNAAFIDVWDLADQYQPGGTGVRTWILNVAGERTMSRYLPGVGFAIGGHTTGTAELILDRLDALLAGGGVRTVPNLP
jgi:hypothetical protein